MAAVCFAVAYVWAMTQHKKPSHPPKETGHCLYLSYF
jgi:hypothetical protein